jgi:large subunit ribosomal protein L28
MIFTDLVITIPFVMGISVAKQLQDKTIGTNKNLISFIFSLGVWQNSPFFITLLSIISYLCPPKKRNYMSRVCQVTGKRPITGNKVSHSNIKTRRRFLPNLQTKRYFLAEEDKWITLKLSTEGIRTIAKNGLYSVIKEMRQNGSKI